MMNESYANKDYDGQSEIIEKKPIIENKTVMKLETEYVPKQKVIEAGGISKHVYSTNPSDNVEENLYSHDKSSKQANAYTTIKGEKVKVGTKEKINPFNVQGVPGCVSCGGSGWKGKGKHPHPCNECAKKTVPIIDTNIVKTSPQTVVNQQVPIQRRVTTEVPFVTGIQELRKTVVPKDEGLRQTQIVEEYKQPIEKTMTVTEHVEPVAYDTKLSSSSVDKNYILSQSRPYYEGERR
jgi:hypothetical protein